VPDTYLSYPLYYYFRRLRPWMRATESKTEPIARYMDSRGEMTPMLLWDTTYQNFMRARQSAESARPVAPPLIVFPDAGIPNEAVNLILPGPFASCSVAPPAQSRTP
jgi:hypothetical protein